MRIAVCLDALLPAPEPAATAAVVRAGEGIEFWDWRPRDLGALQALARAARRPVVAFSANTFDEPLVDPAAHPRALAHIARSIETARQLGARVLVAHVGYAIGGRDRRAQWAAAVAGLRQAGALAAAAGVTLAVEPLNSVLDHPGYFLDTLPDALALLEEVDQPAVRLLLDVYHMRMMHADLLAQLPGALPRTAHVHAADAPGRREPGTGAIDWSAVMGALRAGGYEGDIGLECWPTGEPAAAVRTAIEVLRR